MESNNISLNSFDKSHHAYWNEPENYALVKEVKNNLDYYTIYQVVPNLMLTLFDDFEYALRLSKEMIDHGVGVFDTFSELYAWSKNRS